MAIENLTLLHDEIADHVAGQKPQPEWAVETRSKGRLYLVSVDIAGETVVDVAARDMGGAHRKALDAWRAWQTQTEAYIVEALEVSVETAKAERAAGVAR
jgi:hypothetical protein